MKVTATKKVVQQGNSLCVNVTKECDLIGAERGELVEVTIEKKEEKQVKK